MMKTILALAAGGLLSGCVIPTYVDSRALLLSDDLTRNTITSATCTRGNTPFKITIDPDGTTTGSLILPKRPKGAKWVKPTEFPLSLTARDRKTVLLVVEPGKVTSEAASEALSAVVTKGQVILRGDSFDCVDVKVRLDAV